MAFRELAFERFSLRSYDPYRVPGEDLIRDIIETASWAPSAVNRQPWKFHVLRSHAALEKVRAAYTRDWFMDAPCVVAISGAPSAAWTRKYDDKNFLETDLAIAATFLVMAAQDRGLGTCWISNFEPQVLREALELEPDEEVFFLSPLGWPQAASAPSQVSSPEPGYGRAEAGNTQGIPASRNQSPQPHVQVPKPGKTRKDLGELIRWR